MLMDGLRWTHPVVLGLLAGLGFAVFLVIMGVTWGFNVRQSLIAFVSVMVGSGAGAWFAWRLTKGIRER